MNNLYAGILSNYYEDLNNPDSYQGYYNQSGYQDYMNAIWGSNLNHQCQIQMMSNDNPHRNNTNIQVESMTKLRRLSDELVQRLLDKDCLDFIMENKNCIVFLENEEKNKLRNQFESYKANFFTINAKRKFNIPDQQYEFDQWTIEKKEMSDLTFEEWFSKNNDVKINSPKENLNKIKEYFICMGLGQKIKILDI